MINEICKMSFEILPDFHDLEWTIIQNGGKSKLSDAFLQFVLGSSQYKIPGSNCAIVGRSFVLFCFCYCFLGGGGGGGLSQSKIFHSYGDVTMTGEGLQILTYLGTYGH